jgi:hypothetical protein
MEIEKCSSSKFSHQHEMRFVIVNARKSVKKKCFDGKEERNENKSRNRNNSEKKLRALRM